MVRRYKVLTADSPEKLSLDVTVALEQDWQPCGGVSVWMPVNSREGGHVWDAVYFMQAVVK